MAPCVALVAGRLRRLRRYLFFFTWILKLHVFLFPSSVLFGVGLSKRSRSSSRAGNLLLHGNYARLRLSNSLHSPGRYAYQEGLYEPARCQEGSDRSAGVATFQHPIGMKEEIDSVLDDHS